MLRRVGRLRFPVYELTQGSRVLAQLGRTGWFRTYFGSGQRVELADGTRWTVAAVESGGSLRPVVLDRTSRKVAIAGIAHGTYGINSLHMAGVLVPADASRLRRSNRWILRHLEEDVATVTRDPLSIEAVRPIHLGVVLLSFVLARYGIPEESKPALPSFHWG